MAVANAAFPVRAALMPLRAAALALALAVGSFAGVAHASSDNYRFELVDSEVRPSQQAVTLRMRLVQAVTGEPVSGAAVEATRFGMWPFAPHKTMRPWMAHAAGPIVADGNGVYHLPVEVPMTGSYHLTLSAQIPGGAEPLRDTVRIRVAH